MNDALLLDLGSHSAKAYLLKDRQLTEVGTMTWALLEEESDLELKLRQLSEPHRSSCKTIMAVGTEAMRRKPALSDKAWQACNALGIHYRTLTQEEEADLIRKAVSSKNGQDIINVGGGSIQIVSENTVTLLRFGISDLNRLFALNEEPSLRQIRECIEWVHSRLPDTLSSGFIYTGGEERYLRHLGVRLIDGHCHYHDFEKLSEYLGRLSLDELEALSPHDPKWMRGAVASNCIVLACLKKSEAPYFFPSDINIAHGLIRGITP